MTITWPEAALRYLIKQTQQRDLDLREPKGMWYYANGDEELGPVSPTELKALVRNGVVHHETLVWKDGMEDWAPASKIKGLLGQSASADRSSMAGQYAANPYSNTTGYSSSQPHPDNGGTILVLGILSLVICGPLGIGAWIMGNTYMSECRRRDIEPEGTAVAGRICGIIACCFMILGIVVYGLIIVVAIAGGA